MPPSLKTLRAQLVSCDDSIATLLAEEKAEQQQKSDPWFWCRAAGFYFATSTPLWKSACV